MILSHLITTSVVLSLLVSATPLQRRTGLRIPLTKLSSVSVNGVVNVNVLYSHMLSVEAKLARGFESYQRNTGSPHPNAYTILSRRETVGVNLTDDGGVLWQGTIAVGTPPVEFNVDFDTGSGDLFLPGVNCSQNCQGHTLYDTAASSTATDQGSAFILRFGDGSSVQGEIFTDTVTIGGLTATNQGVGSATQYSTGFAAARFSPDGLMGMAFPEIADFALNPVFNTLVLQGQVADPVFSFKLASPGSELFLGGLDSAQFTGAITYVPVTQVGFWQVRLDSIDVNGGSAINQLLAIIDTGTTLIIGDTQSVTTVYAAIPGAADASLTVGPGFFTFPCNSVPTVSLTFGGTAFTISDETFNLGRVSEGSSDCVGGIVASDSNTGMWIIGDTFLQNVYTTFDVVQTRVGFANLTAY